jgi:putative FmdB family regulatory protein
MPLYQYVCEKCDHSFEALVFAGDDDATCPQCESGRVAKQLTVPAAPPSESASLPMGCDASLPPCGPACCRLPDGANN